MKELSIEEKAKRYDEAKYIMKKYLESGNTGVIAEITIKNAFPELSESEDERIRKALIWHLTRVDNEIPLGAYHSIDGIEIKDMLAWLEKQGEQKLNPVLDIEIPFGAKDSELQEASYHIPEGFHAEIEGNRVVIKRGEQKSADNIKKPWSEEDNEHLERILRELKNQWQRPSNKPYLDEIVSDYYLLNSIKNRVQPKREWSEEDNKNLEKTIWYMEEGGKLIFAKKERN